MFDNVFEWTIMTLYEAIWRILNLFFLRMGTSRWILPQGIKNNNMVLRPTNPEDVIIAIALTIR